MSQWLHTLWNSIEGLTKMFYATQWAMAVFGLLTVAAIVLSNVVSRKKDRLINAEEVKRVARTLTGRQSSDLIDALSSYHGQKIVILVAAGQEPLAFAGNFVVLFKSAGWQVSGPYVAPFDQNAVGLQISINSKYFGSHPPPPVKALFDTLRGMNIGCRDTYVTDPSVSPDIILFWVGTKTNL